jgi:hypothetical protein
VSVDLRIDSPTFKKWVGVELSANNGRQLWIPEGFAHGFQVLEDGTVFSYKCTVPYSPADEHSLRWDDPGLGIEWPLADPVVSSKDAAAPLFMEAESFCVQHGVPIRRLIELIAHTMGVEPKVQQLPEQPGDVRRTFADVRRAGDLLGYNSQTPIESGIQIFSDWLRCDVDIAAPGPQTNSGIE